MRAEPVASRLFPQTVIEQERRLPRAGDVLVEVGDWVDSGDVVAACERPGALRVVDVAAALNIPQNQLERYLRVTVGDEVVENQVLASSGFMGWRAVRSPVTGTVGQAAAGRLFIQEQAQRHELKAHLSGQVARVIPGLGVVIRATVARVVGVWGSGEMCSGPLMLRTQRPGEALQWIGIDLDCRGKIVVGGECLDRRVLLRAARFRALGLVVGGLAEHLRAQVQELGLTVVVTDGLGAVPMAGPVFDLFKRYAGQVAALVGNGEVANRRILPAVNISLKTVQGAVSTGREARPLAVGDRVRLTRPPHLGAAAWVRAIQQQDGERVVQVALDDGSLEMVAYRNLERLG